MLVEFKNVWKRLDKFALRDISFALPKGYIMGLIGPNGAGKTTLLHLLLGLYRPTQGDVIIEGEQYAEAEANILNKIGAVLLDELFDNTLTLLQNAKAYGRYYSNYSEDILIAYLNLFELDSNRKYKELSKGEKLKYQFAFALSHDAKLLILDEPTGNFDPGFREEFFRIIKAFIADGERSVILATHLTEDLDKIADYILYLDKGKTIFSGDIESLRTKYRLITGEQYKINLLHKEQVIHVETGQYGTRALVKHGTAYTYDPSLTVTAPTIEEFMYFMTKKGDNK